MIRRLAALALPTLACLGGSAQAADPPGPETLLAARPAATTEQVRRQLLAGDMPAFAADLRARAEVAGARRFAQIETCGAGDPVVTLLVDDGEFTRVYQRSAGWHTAIGHDGARLVREAPHRSFDALWRTLQAHAATPPAAPASGTSGTPPTVVGFTILHDADGEREFLLLRDDLVTSRHTTRLDDLLGDTLLAGLHYRSGEVAVPGWLANLLERLRRLPPSPREERDDGLWSAVRRGDWPRAKSLVDAGADPNAFAGDGESLAHWLYVSQDPAAGRHLALLHADPARPTFFGETPPAAGP